MRRWERRLRSWLRHERMTVAMALAGQLHRVERDEALRRQTTRASGQDEVHELYDGLRAQKRPPPGERPGTLAKPGLQRSDRSLRRSSGEAPLLGVPSLADAPAEAIDGRTLRYLLKLNLALAKKEEDEEERRKLVEGEQRRKHSFWDDFEEKECQRTSRRKRKKRRMKRLPRSPLPQGRRRACALQRRVPAVQEVREPGDASDSVHLHALRIPVVMQGQVPTVHKLQVLFLEVVVMPVVVQRQVRGSMLQKTVVVPQLLFFDGHQHPCRGAEADPMVQTIQQTTEIPQLFLDKVVNAPICRSCRSSKFLSWRRGRFPWSCRPWKFPCRSWTR